MRKLRRRELLLFVVIRFQLGLQLFNERLVFLVWVLHQNGFGEVIFKLFFSLKSSVGNLANLFWVELRPRFTVVVVVETFQRLEIDEVNKSIPDVAIVLHVNRQIKKIVFALELPIYFWNQEFFGKLIRNVLHHDRRFLFRENFRRHNFVFFLIGYWLRVFFLLLSLFGGILGFKNFLLRVEMLQSWLILTVTHIKLRLIQLVVLTHFS